MAASKGISARKRTLKRRSKPRYGAVAYDLEPNGRQRGRETSRSPCASCRAPRMGYAGKSAAPSTAALAARTNSGNPRIMALKIAQHQEPANERCGNSARHQHQPALDEIADRLAEPPQQRGQQKKPEAARYDRGEREGEKVEFRDPAR